MRARPVAWRAVNSPIPHRFDPTHSLAQIRDGWKDLEPGSETGQKVTVAGRMMLRREQGKLAFGTLRDWTGEVQLFAGAKWTDDFAGFCGIGLGTWVGATGEVMTTKRGELSVKVESWTLLATNSRGFGDKWKGITDQDLRYRHREADLWANEDTRPRMLLRSRLISLTRRFLEDRKFVEVETPTFHPTLGGALAKPFTTHHNALDVDLYLRIAPELYLKRLVVGGMERVFEMARVFRNEGLSPRHNPEFTMLEAYWAYADYTEWMNATEELVSFLAAELTGSTTVQVGGRNLNLATPWRRATLANLTSEAVGEQISIHTPLDRLRALCDTHQVPWEDYYGPGKLLLELYEKTVEATLWEPTFVIDYPKEVSPLSRDHRDDPGLVERFELIVAGRELANAFSELQDPAEQRKRFEAQLDNKAHGDDEAMELDEEYLAALEYGLPPTAGIGIGIDRLTMLLSGAETIRDVLLFPTLKPLPASSEMRSSCDESQNP